MITAYQKTINRPIKLTGIGLHNGLNADLVINPAKENFGIKFCRVDLSENNLINANFKNVVEPILCTKISNKDGVTVSTVEHLMAALYGEGIDNALIEVNSSEIPILDGSSSEFVEAIRAVGVKEQSSLRQFIKVEKKIEIREGEKFISIEPSNNDLIIDFEIIYGNPLIRTRRKEFKLSQDKLTEIYNSRTFCLYEDIDLIKSKGLAKGGSLDNAIVVKDNEILNDDGLRNRHEFVYHKILDCIGDLMLSGNRIIGHIITSQGGHALTNKLLLKFFSDKSNWSLKSIESINTKAQEKQNIKKPLAANV
jgi:UDP-3-O-[3-hydroxymyristoyl] N-acetylglucosamine deacetylase